MLPKTTVLVSLFCHLLISSCSEKDISVSTEENMAPLFRLLNSDSTNLKFNNQIKENESFNMVDYFYVYNGGGVSIGDINNDSLPDIYFTGNMVEDRLYLNKGGLRFEDISIKSGIDTSGWSTGVTMVDINHDELLDIYVCRSGNLPPNQRRNLFYINQGNLTFKESAADIGLADESYSTQATFFDYDRDGDLDMYLLNHTNEMRSPNDLKPPLNNGEGLANDRLYRNEERETSQLKFTDVTLEAGIRYDGLGLGVGVADIDNDGWQDILITNDFLANDYLYINKQDGTFKEVSKTDLDHVSHFSMGNDLADINNDGLIDAITLDMLPRDNYSKKKMSGPFNNDLFQSTLQMGYVPQFMRNTLQLNQGYDSNGRSYFSEIGQLSGISATDWSWAPLFADFDNDGWKDLFITNGYLRNITDLDFINYTASLSTNDSLDTILKKEAKAMPPIKLHNFIFQNSGNLKFEDMSMAWGMNQPSLSNGAAYADLDNDGDLDIVINNINAQASVYENRSDALLSNNHIAIRLEGDTLNPNALGTSVTVFHDGGKQLVHQSLTRGYQSSVEPKLHFGLGKSTTIDSILVKWADGTQTLKKKDLLANSLVTLKKKNAARILENYRNTKKTIFSETKTDQGFDHRHLDPEYNDFNRQFLLPHKHSNQGPGVAVTDVNNDGIEDFFIGGGYNQSGTLFFGAASGKFKTKKLIQNEKEKYEEDTGVLFFDYDGDNDKDLYIVSGSNEFFEGSPYYQDRLYTNDGLGNFQLDTKALPRITSSGSCVRAADFDKDGDLDLFVGGRITPLKYPLPPNSYLLLNTNGKFTDATNSLAPSLRKAGMVTDALWTDYDTDGDLDLIVVGEFMAIQFYENQEGKLVNSSEKTGLRFTSGWWNSINGGDFDNDGDIDYILGNIGHNTKYKVSPKQPMTVYALDYDKNGVIDPLITAYTDGVEYPIHSRDDLIRQIPEMKKKFTDYESYAKATFAGVISSQQKSSSYTAKAFNFASSYLQNNGDGTFKLIYLPVAAQIAPLYGIIIQDFNGDGNLDLLLSGNNKGAEVSMGRYDASKGTLLFGSGDGGFMVVPNYENGLYIDGETRGVASVRNGNSYYHIFARNSDDFKMFRLNTDKVQGKVITIPENSTRATIVYTDGTKRKKEFYYGSSYLSQSSCSIFLNDNIKKVIAYDSKGNEVFIYEGK